MRTITRLAVALLALVVLAPAALAANVHWKTKPTFTDNGLTLTAAGALAGLGNEDLTITLDAVGAATKIICTNRGGNQAPGQNKPRVYTSGTQTISANEIKNGNVSFRLTTANPGAISAKEAGCPNATNWTARIVDVTFSSATITVVQGGEVVLKQTFTL